MHTQTRVEKNHVFFKYKKIVFYNLNWIFFYFIFLIWYTQCHKIFDYQAVWCQNSYTLCAFVLKNTQNFVDLDACKQLFVLNSYKSAIKKIGSKKNKKH